MKEGRQEKLIDIIENEDILNQEELTQRLNEEGYKVTQATVSRDLRQLRIAKIAVPGGKAKYVRLDDQIADEDARYRRVLKEGILTIENTGNLLVIKTVSGLAMAVAAALDNFNIYGIIGSIAGDDTIFCALREDCLASEVIESIGSFVKEEVKDVTESSR